MTTHESTQVPDTIRDVEHLELLLSTPTEGVIDTFSRLEGDVIILGVAGKMGPTLAWMARRAFDAAGRRDRRVLGVARFTDARSESWLRDRGVETIRCDLLEPDALEHLPEFPNVMSMFAMKFGSSGMESQTWVMNSFLPGLVALRYRGSRIVAFSTGNVYPLVPASHGGSTETDPPQPVGEYGMSCLGRERILEHLGRTMGIPTALIRLNYAAEMRYGVLVDLARQVLAGTPIDVAMGYFNVIWQADASAFALRAFEHAAIPPLVLNVTGPEILSVRQVAGRFAERFGVAVSFQRRQRHSDALLSDAAPPATSSALPSSGPRSLIEMTADWLRAWRTSDHRTSQPASRPCDGRF